MSDGTDRLDVAVVGSGWMGRVHSLACAPQHHHVPDLARTPELVLVAHEDPGRAEAAAARFGFASAVRDWREVLSTLGSTR